MEALRQAERDPRCVLALEGITKRFPGVVALNKICHSFHSGRIHAVVGENGAGKSTLMNIIDGSYQPTEGRIFVDGKEAVLRDPLQAQRLGIAMVHQEGSLLKHLTIMENIFLNACETYAFGIIKKKTMRQKTITLLDMLKISDLSPDTPARELSIGQRRMVEVAKALSSKPKILILDEPTASLTESDTEILLRVLRGLREEGLSILYISHRLEEIFALADDVTVLRDGEKAGTYAIGDITLDQLIAKMVGRTLNAEMEELSRQKDQMQVERSEPFFSLRNLNLHHKLKDIWLDVYKGEVLGLAGLVGSGRSETAEAIMGYVRADSIQMEMEGKRIAAGDPSAALRHGIAMAPEDRREKGVFDRLSVMDNLNLVNLPAMRKGLVVSKRRQRAMAAKFCETLNIRTPDLGKKIGELSGGNQQKVILARYLSLKNRPKLLILDEPTYGIDVGAKAEIYKIIRELQEGGMAILLISSDMNELMTLSNRIVVYHEGRIVGEIDRSEEFDQQKILNLASGLKF